MAKTEISKKRGPYLVVKVRKLRPTSTATEYDPSSELANPRFIQKAIVQALLEGDLEGVRNIYKAHLRVLNRSDAAKTLKVSRQHVHRMIDDPNPRLDTFVGFMGILKDEAQAAHA